MLKSTSNAKRLVFVWFLKDVISQYLYPTYTNYIFNITFSKPKSMIASLMIVSLIRLHLKQCSHIYKSQIRIIKPIFNITYYELILSLP